MARRAKGIFLLTVVMISLISATKEAPAVTFRAPRAGLVRRGTDSHHLGMRLSVHY
jgi:kynureninase